MDVTLVLLTVAGDTENQKGMKQQHSLLSNQTHVPLLPSLYCVWSLAYSEYRATVERVRGGDSTAAAQKSGQKGKPLLLSMDFVRASVCVWPCRLLTW